MPRDISIEYAHIYTNDHIGDEHKLSLNILSSVKKEHQKGSLSLVVMVDDYSFPDPSFDYGAFSAWLQEHGFKPDLILRESQLIPLCDETLNLVEDGYLKNQILDYVKTKKYPCSLFIATWYLIRLGYIESAAFDKDLISGKLINILPMSFKPFEDKAFEIIETTPFTGAVERIKNEYFNGRLLA